MVAKKKAKLKSDVKDFHLTDWIKPVLDQTYE